ncbi:testis anion transporter 1 isoform X5 [Castor canadensis]|uniref:Testis anion transporter 1 isoform X5 n=1 Tax=Castor canadensis TaxID=51338 RepID=A0AC58N9V2_CASCN
MMHPESSVLGSNYKYRQNPFTYDVKRDVYNEETFQQEHRRRALSSRNVDIDITTFRHHVQCRCSWHKFLRCVLTIFPFLEWMCLYRFKDWLLGDLLAGISVGLVQVPQGLTLSLLTRQLIPPLNVTYAAFCSSVIYVIFGSCHQMSIGPFFLVSALMINVLKERPFNSGHLILGTFLKDDFSAPSFFVNYNRSLSTVATTTLLTGIIQLFMGMLGVGFVATYLPEAAVRAYLAAAALHIMLSQLTCIFGVVISFHAGPIAFFYNIINYCIGLPRTNSTSILLFLTAVVALRINKCIRISFNRYPIEFPMELFLILGFTVLSNKISMATETSRTLIEMIPYSFTFPMTPDFSILPQIIFQAISLSLVSSFLLIFTGKKIARIHNYKVNSNQDLIAIGLCNVVSSFFRSCVFTSAIARTIIQDKSGGRQQFASLVGAGVMLLLMVKVGSFFYELPNAVLAGVVLSNVVPYLETIYELPNLWRQNQYDCVIWMVTFSAAIFLGLDIGLLVSLVFTFFIITVRSHRTKIFLLGQIPNTNIYRSVNDYREVILIPGVKIFQCCNSITFVNVYHLKHKLLKEMCNSFHNANILVIISGCHSSVVRAFEKNDFFDSGITKSQLFLSLHDAVLFASTRKLPDSSELSVDESETVIQETYSETDKNDKAIQKMSSSFIENPKNVNPSFVKMQNLAEEEELDYESEMEPTLESEQEDGLDLKLALDRDLEDESELYPGYEPETEPETEPEPQLDTEPEPETEPETNLEMERERKPEPKSESRSHMHSRQHYWPVYQSGVRSSSSVGQSRTRSVERRRHHMDSYLSQDNSDDAWKMKYK